MPLSSLLICISSSFLHLFLLSPFRLLSPAKSLANAAGLSGIHHPALASRPDERGPAGTTSKTCHRFPCHRILAWIDNVSKICFIRAEFLLNVTWPGRMKKGETFAASLNKPRRIMLSWGNQKLMALKQEGGYFQRGCPAREILYVSQLSLFYWKVV